MKLTDAAVRRLTCGEGERVDHYDVTLPGFGVRVAGPTPRSPDGRKTWMFYYRFGCTQKRLTLGTYPALSLADARRQAGDALQLLSSGADPAEIRAAAAEERGRPRESLGQVAQRFLTDGMRLRKGRPLAPRYIVETRRSIENHVLPRWRNVRLESVTRKDVKALLQDVAARVDPPGVGRAATPHRARGGPIAANRALSALSAMFSWAIREELTQINPCTLVEPPGEERRGERVFSQDELHELWGVLDACGYPFGTFLQVALLTGQRRIEVAGMQWDEVDLDSRLWTVRTKGGRRNAVPLSDRVAMILATVPRKARTDGSTSRFVFTTSGRGPICGFSRAKVQIDRLISASRTTAGVAPMTPWRIHDLRRTCATGLGRLGTPEAVISKVCGHAPKGVTNQIYNLYEYIDEKRLALDRWSRHVEQLQEGPHPLLKRPGRDGTSCGANA